MAINPVKFRLTEMIREENGKNTVFYEEKDCILRPARYGD